MELEFKPDFAAARRDWDTYWAQGLPGRPMVAMEVPRDEAAAALRPPGGVDLLRDLPGATERLLAWARGRHFLAGAVPACIVQFGPDHFSACLGAEMQINAHSGDTTWIVPCIEKWEEADIRFRPDSWCWQKTVECVEYLRERCEGKLLIGGPNLQGGLDCLSAIRGPEPLAMDLVEQPEKVQAALRKVEAAYDACLAAIIELFGVRQWGMITRHGMYATGTINVPQCDFSCMLSAEMFAEFGLPSVRHEAEVLDAAEYHLDGPDAIRHLEAVASIDAIKAIQWQPGAGWAAGQDWRELLQRIDGLGKGVLVYPKPQEAAGVYARYKSNQVYMRMHAGSLDEARRTLDAVAAVRAG